MQGKSLVSAPETQEFAFDRTEIEACNDQKYYFRNKLDDWVDDEFNLDNIEDVNKLIYETDKDLRTAYDNEYEFIIQFQLIIQLLAKNLRVQEQNYLFKFIREKKAEMFVMGIAIEIPSVGTIARKFASVIT